MAYIFGTPTITKEKQYVLLQKILIALTPLSTHVVFIIAHGVILVKKEFLAFK